jgi:hypothetical protein
MARICYALPTLSITHACNFVIRQEVKSRNPQFYWVKTLFITGVTRAIGNSVLDNAVRQRNDLGGILDPWFPGFESQGSLRAPRGNGRGRCHDDGLRGREDNRVSEEADQAKAGLYTVHDYQMPNVLGKVVRIIHSYVNYVNTTVWRKMPES